MKQWLKVICCCFLLSLLCLFKVNAQQTVPSEEKEELHWTHRALAYAVINAAREKIARGEVSEENIPELESRINETEEKLEEGTLTTEEVASLMDVLKQISGTALVNFFDKHMPGVKEAWESGKSVDEVVDEMEDEEEDEFTGLSEEDAVAEMEGFMALYLAQEVIDWVRSTKGIIWYVNLYRANRWEKAARILEIEALNSDGLSQVTRAESGSSHTVSYTIGISEELSIEQEVTITSDLSEGALFNLLHETYGINGLLSGFVFEDGDIEQFCRRIGNYYDDVSRDALLPVGYFIAGVAAAPGTAPYCIIEGKDFFSGEEITGFWRALCILDLIPGAVLARASVTRFIARIGRRAIRFTRFSDEAKNFLAGASRQHGLVFRAASDDLIEIVDGTGAVVGRFNDGQLQVVKSLDNGNAIDGLTIGEYQLARNGDEVGFLATGAGKLVENLNLGKFVKKIGDYDVFENGEVFYRGMSQSDYQYLLTNGKIRAPLNSPTSEVFTSPSLEYIKSVGYGGDGVIVKFKMKPGTLDNLASNGVRDQSNRAAALFPEMPSTNISGWEANGKVYFKQETIKNTTIKQVNIGLGKNENGGLKLFNGENGSNILEFQIVQ